MQRPPDASVLSGFIQTFADEAFDLQRPADVAVIIPTILRSTLVDALQSVFNQNLAGRIQILVGVDVPLGDLSMVANVCSAKPANYAVQVFYPGYSTSGRHGGLAASQNGGELRTVLSYLANSPLLAYLDDDNWWHPNHLRSMCAAIQNSDWAFSLRWFVHPATRRPICVDEWESLGPGRGVFTADFGGFVDTNCLMINKLRCADVLPFWRIPLTDGRAPDRRVFEYLRHIRGTGTEMATVYYQLDPNDINHPGRLSVFGQRYEWAGEETSGQPRQVSVARVRPLAT